MVHLDQAVPLYLATLPFPWTLEDLDFRSVRQILRLQQVLEIQ